VTVFDDIKAITSKPPHNLRVCGVVTSRLGSERFWRKGVSLLAGRPAWWHCMERVKHAAKEAGIELVGCAVATSTKPENDLLEQQAKEAGYDCVRYWPEQDRPGRMLATLDHFDCDIMVHCGADTPLAMTDLVKATWSVMRDYNLLAYPKWPRNERSAHPTMRSAFAVVAAVTAYPRWYFWYKRTIAHNLAQLQDWITEDQEPELWRLVPTPKQCWINYPEWAWDYWREYQLELDDYEDGVTIGAVYDALWKEGSVVDVRQAIDYLDAHPWLVANRNAPVSELDKTNRAARELTWQDQWLRYAEFYLTPEYAHRLYCPKCAEYVGWYDGMLHRPDGTLVYDTDRLYCRAGHTYVWEVNLETALRRGDVVSVPPIGMPEC
jgi:spore coat polysaccharide biosynthesis protein SpsF